MLNSLSKGAVNLNGTAVALSILIFDSGVGGLTIFDEVKKQLPNAHYNYLFDNQLFPYGELKDQQLIDRVNSLITHAARQFNADIIIIACNSASTLALPVLRKNMSIPIVGVVPAIKPAALMTRNGVIGLLATPGTVMRSYTAGLINEFAGDKTILPIGSSELVQMAEDKMAGMPVDLKCLAKILWNWSGSINKPDVIVLGCTHFPIIKQEIAEVLNYPVRFIDSGKAIGARVQQLALQKVTSEQLDKKNRIHCTRLTSVSNQLITSFEKYNFFGVKQFNL